MTVTNTFKINGTSISQPTEHGWIERRDYGRDGAGHLVLPALREYSLQWDSMSPEDFFQLVGLYNSNGITGTIVADLPQWGVSAYQFYAYSGCIIGEPSYSGYFENQYQGVRLLIASVRT